MLSVFANAGSSEKLVSDYLELTYSDGRNGNTAQQKLILICFNTSECTGVDPEVVLNNNQTGASAYGVYPVGKQFTAGINVKF